MGSFLQADHDTPNDFPSDMCKPFNDGDLDWSYQRKRTLSQEVDYRGATCGDLGKKP